MAEEPPGELSWQQEPVAAGAAQATARNARYQPGGAVFPVRSWLLSLALLLAACSPAAPLPATACGWMSCAASGW